MKEAQERLKTASWKAVTAILMVLLCGVTGVLFSQINKQQSLTAELHHVAEEILTARNNTKLLQIQIFIYPKQLLNSTYQNFNLLGSEAAHKCKSVKLHLDVCSENTIQPAF